MKFKINKDIIENEINDASLTISSNNTLSLPIYKAVYVEVFNNEVIIKSSNTSISMKTKIPVEEKKLEVESTGSFLTPIKQLHDLIRKTDSKILLFEKTKENILTISTNKSRYSLQLYKTEDYPKTDFGIKGKKISINKKLIEEVNQKISFSADNEHKQNRKEFSGINLYSDDEKSYFVATNMHRLSKIDFQNQENINIIIPINMFKMINKTNSFKNSEIEIWISDEKTQLKSKNSILQFQNIVGKYPDISSVIPKEFQTTTIVGKTELEKALDRINSFTNEENKIQIKITDENFYIKSANQKTGTSIEKIDNFNKQGDDIEISISSKYLLDAIKTTSNKEIKLKFNSDKKPVLIEDPTQHNIKHIVLPYRSK